MSKRFTKGSITEEFGDYNYDPVDVLIRSLHTSKRNPENICGYYDHRFVTIYVTKEGYYKFSIDDGELFSSSKASFAEPYDAAAALLDILEREEV